MRAELFAETVGRLARDEQEAGRPASGPAKRRVEGSHLVLEVPMAEAADVDEREGVAERGIARVARPVERAKDIQIGAGRDHLDGRADRGACGVLVAKVVPSVVRQRGDRRRALQYFALQALRRAVEPPTPRPMPLIDLFIGPECARIDEQRNAPGDGVGQQHRRAEDVSPVQEIGCPDEIAERDEGRGLRHVERGRGDGRRLVVAERRPGDALGDWLAETERCPRLLEAHQIEGVASPREALHVREHLTRAERIGEAVVGDVHDAGGRHGGPRSSSARATREGGVESSVLRPCPG